MAQQTYFSELSPRLQREHIAFGQSKNDCLPVLLDGQEIGVVTLGGSMRIRKECMDEPDAGDLYRRVGEIAAEVQEYRNLLEDAPPLKVSSLGEPYKLLADFNGYVLGAMETEMRLGRFCIYIITPVPNSKVGFKGKNCYIDWGGKDTVTTRRLRTHIS